MSNATVVALWRYPIKSMMGEELNASEVTEHGLLGDRAYALLDPSDGHVVSAKNPRKWPNMFDFRASLSQSPRIGEKAPAARITLPDGTTVNSEQPDINEILSGVLGRAVALAAKAPDTPHLEEYWPDIDGLAHRETVTDETIALSAPPGTFFDYAAVHLLTTATLARLSELYPSGRFETRRFRPNVVVEVASGEKGFVENDWIGRTLMIGEQVRLNVAGPCPRCVMTTLPQGDLPKDPGILRTSAQHNQANVGIYATVVQGGTIRRGDSVRLE
jgi:uncharacterized protein YcbX